MRILTLLTALVFAWPCSAQWTKIQSGVATPTASNPGNRSGHKIAYDRWHGECVMFGDSGMSTGDATYTLKAGVWTREAGGLASRDNVALAYHDIGKTVLLFGGFDGTNYKNSVYRFDFIARAWVVVPASGTAPSARDGATWANQRLTNNMFLFGGYDGTNLLNDTWKFTYNPVFRTGIWANVSHATQRPTACRDAQMLYDYAYTRLILSSGLTATGRQLNTEYINGNPTAVNTWVNLFTSSDVGRQGRGVYVAHNDKILFGQGFLSTTGGVPATNQANRVFGMVYLNQITSNSWIAETGSATAPPEPGYLGGMAAIDKLNEIVVYGGLQNTGVGTAAVGGDTWIFNCEAQSSSMPDSNASCGQNSEFINHSISSQAVLNTNLSIDAVASNYGAGRIGVWVLTNGYTPLYFPGTTSCYVIPDLGASSVVMTIMTMDAMHNTASVFIPNVPALAGQDYYSQVFNADATANTPGIVFSECHRVIIGAF